MGSTDRVQVQSDASTALALLALAVSFGCSPGSETWSAGNEDRPILSEGNDAARFDVAFALATIRLTARPEAAASWSVALALDGVGRPGAMRPAAPPLGPPVREQHRVAYERPGLGEWYESDSRGLEQGFTLAKPPPGEGELTISVSVRGDLVPVLERNGQRVALRADDGAAALYYTDLEAHDAAGRRLDGHLAVSGSAIELHVDDRGAEYPIVIDPLVWQQLGPKLLASDGDSDDAFGTAIALSGDTVLIGAPASDTHYGQAYLFFRDGSSWTTAASKKLTGGSKGNGLGTSVALSGDTALVGAPGEGAFAPDAGKAYVFVRAGASWAKQAELIPAGLKGGDRFGMAVALEGDTALVGAPRDDTQATDAGAVYWFERKDTQWKEWSKITVATSAASDYVGFAVALSGDTALLGAYGNDAQGADAGAAYVFVRAGSAWVKQATLLAKDGAAGDRFGWSVALLGDTALVGAPNHGGDVGAAYVFSRTGSSWQNKAMLTAADGNGADLFGMAVSLADARALIGAPTDLDNGAKLGSAYLFKGSGASWTEETKLTTVDGGLFGVAVALADDTAFIGAKWDDEKGSNSGSAHVYRLALDAGSPCEADADCHSGQCVDGACCEGTCHALAESCDGDDDCQSQHCVDEVCCDAACDDRCDACNLAASVGSCTPIGDGEPGEPDCASHVLCDGERPSCPDGCALDEDCAPGYRCAEESCVEKTGASCADEETLTKPDGATVDCRPYRCDGGACLSQCASTVECASGWVCSAAGQCVAQAAPGGDEGGCGCRLGRRDERGRAQPEIWLALFAMASLVGRARGRAGGRSEARGTRRAPGRTR